MAASPTDVRPALLDGAVEKFPSRSRVQVRYSSQVTCQCRVTWPVFADAYVPAVNYLT